MPPLHRRSLSSTSPKNPIQILLDDLSSPPAHLAPIAASSSSPPTTTQRPTSLSCLPLQALPSQPTSHLPFPPDPRLSLRHADSVDASATREDSEDPRRRTRRAWRLSSASSASSSLSRFEHNNDRIDERRRKGVTTSTNTTSSSTSCFSSSLSSTPFSSARQSRRKSRMRDVAIDVEIDTDTDAEEEGEGERRRKEQGREEETENALFQRIHRLASSASAILRAPRCSESTLRENERRMSSPSPSANAQTRQPQSSIIPSLSKVIDLRVLRNLGVDISMRTDFATTKKSGFVKKESQSLLSTSYDPFSDEMENKFLLTSLDPDIGEESLEDISPRVCVPPLHLSTFAKETTTGVDLDESEMISARLSKHLSELEAESRIVQSFSKSLVFSQFDSMMKQTRPSKIASDDSVSLSLPTTQSQSGKSKKNGPRKLSVHRLGMSNAMETEYDMLRERILHESRISGKPEVEILAEMLHESGKSSCASPRQMSSIPAVSAFVRENARRILEDAIPENQENRRRFLMEKHEERLQKVREYQLSKEDAGNRLNAKFIVAEERRKRVLDAIAKKGSAAKYAKDRRLCKDWLPICIASCRFQRWISSLQSHRNNRRYLYSVALAVTKIQRWFRQKKRKQRVQRLYTIFFREVWFAYAKARFLRRHRSGLLIRKFARDFGESQQFARLVSKFRNSIITIQRFWRVWIPHCRRLFEEFCSSIQLHETSAPGRRIWRSERRTLQMMRRANIEHDSEASLLSSNITEDLSTAGRVMESSSKKSSTKNFTSTVQLVSRDSLRKFFLQFRRESIKRHDRKDIDFDENWSSYKTAANRERTRQRLMSAKKISLRSIPLPAFNPLSFRLHSSNDKDEQLLKVIEQFWCEKSQDMGNPNAVEGND